VFQEELDAADRAEQKARAAQADAGELMAALGEIRSREAAAAAEKLELIARLHARPEMIPLPARGSRGSRHRDLDARDLVAEEIRLFFGLTRREAERMVDTALTLDTCLPETMAELKAGRLGYARAAKIAQHTKHLTDHHYRQAIEAGMSPQSARQRAAASGARVEALILARAAGMLPWDLEQAMIATVMLIDPAFAIAQRKTNHRGRGVSHRTNPGEGTGDLFARLPAAEALAIYTTLDAYARRFRDTGDPRTLDELRADALIGIFFDTLDTAADVPAPTDKDDDKDDNDCKDSQDGADTVSEPAEADGDGDRDGDGGEAEDRGGAADDDGDGDADRREGEHDDIDGHHRRDTTSDITDPGRTRPTSPPSENPSPANPPPDIPPDSNTPGHHHADRTGAGELRGARGDWTLRPRSPLSRLRTEVHVTIDLDTLLGLNDNPAHLTGHGPIDAAYARALAHGPDSTWRRLITDPVTGQLLDYGRTRYRPPTALADHVRARDTTCRTPGCPHPATHCDLDHIVPYPAGTTSNDNLHPKCRHHHRLKHEGRWHHAISDNPHHPPHTIILTSPTGQHYITHASNYHHPHTQPTPDTGRGEDDPDHGQRGQQG
jgi:Domain of unknown function (DUF222)